MHVHMQGLPTEGAAKALLIDVVVPPSSTRRSRWPRVRVGAIQPTSPIGTGPSPPAARWLSTALTATRSARQWRRSYAPLG